MPSQQSSFSGTRTKLTCQAAIARTDATLEGPSKMPHPWMQAYSGPERSTPRRITVRPRASRRCAPTTWRPRREAVPASTRAAATEARRASTSSAPTLRIPPSVVRIEAHAITRRRTCARPPEHLGFRSCRCRPTRRGDEKALYLQRFRGGPRHCSRALGNHRRSDPDPAARSDAPDYELVQLELVRLRGNG